MLDYIRNLYMYIYIYPVIGLYLDVYIYYISLEINCWNPPFFFFFNTSALYSVYWSILKCLCNFILCNYRVAYINFFPYFFGCHFWETVPKSTSLDILCVLAEKKTEEYICIISYWNQKFFRVYYVKSEHLHMGILDVYQNQETLNFGTTI